MFLAIQSTIHGVIYTYVCTEYIRTIRTTVYNFKQGRNRSVEHWIESLFFVLQYMCIYIAISLRFPESKCCPITFVVIYVYT